MMRNFIAVGLLLQLTGSLWAQINDGKYIIDYKNSRIEWRGEKIVGTHHVGTLRVSSGTMVVSGNTITSGKVKVDVNSIANLDVTDPEYNAKLVNHLKSEDFFHAAKYPDAVLDIVSGSPKSDAQGNTHEIKGKLTIKGITQEITFPAKVENKDKKFYASGDFVFDRSKFDVKYGSTAFFSDLGNKAISNDIRVTFNFIGNI